jgi:hypothetical protein
VTGSPKGPAFSLLLNTKTYVDSELLYNGGITFCNVSISPIPRRRHPRHHHHHHLQFRNLRRCKGISDVTLCRMVKSYWLCGWMKRHFQVQAVQEDCFFWLFLDCLTTKMKALRQYETPVTIHQSTRRTVSEHSNLHQHRWVNSHPSLLRHPLVAAGVITVSSSSALSVTGTHRYSGVKLWFWQRSWWSLITFH